ncbi:MAG: hypothetical protein CM1200mP16_06040 [Nitrospina sp.]|nr:MAG: hypothetical protein CM1200mP16_06040 [Nitrospina sp.]
MWLKLIRGQWRLIYNLASQKIFFIKVVGLIQPQLVEKKLQLKQLIDPTVETVVCE